MVSAFDRVLRPRRAAERGGDSTYPMDLLEYQGKQLFAKHGVPVPDGQARHDRRRRRWRPPRSSATRCDQGPGPDRRPRQGRRHQAGQRPRRGRGARHGDPRHGHPRLHRPRAVRGEGLGDRRGVLRGDRLRPLGEEADGRCSRGWAAWTWRRSPRRPRGDADAARGPAARASRTSTARRLAFESGIAEDVIRPVGRDARQALRRLRGARTPRSSR